MTGATAPVLLADTRDRTQPHDPTDRDPRCSACWNAIPHSEAYHVARLDRFEAFSRG